MGRAFSSFSTSLTHQYTYKSRLCQVQNEARGIALAHNVPAKEDVAEVLMIAAAAGGRIVKPAQDVFGGGHSGYFADPDGHLWEVAWNPFLKLNPRGEY
jgi:predicted lactoylglutathione lyase